MSLVALIKFVERNIRVVRPIDSDSFLSLNCYSSVAQLVEQTTVNRWVAGSSPARGAILRLSRAPALARFVWLAPVY
jgi:hypothetical protein